MADAGNWDEDAIVLNGLPWRSWLMLAIFAVATTAARRAPRADNFEALGATSVGFSVVDV